jgi:hypothetical protein
MYEWVMTEHIYISTLESAGTDALITTDGKAVAVQYRYGNGPDVIYFNQEKYIIGEPAAECLVTWMHTASVEFRQEQMELKAHDWDEDLGPLHFYRPDSQLQAIMQQTETMRGYSYRIEEVTTKQITTGAHLGTLSMCADAIQKEFGRDVIIIHD